MLFQITWPNGSRTHKIMMTLRDLDRFVAAQFALGLEVDLRPTDEGPLLVISDAAGASARLSA